MEILHYLQTHLSQFQLSVFRLIVWLAIGLVLVVAGSEVWEHPIFIE